MPAATASGADAKSNGSAQNRSHNQGNQDRSYTIEQKAAVLRVRKCQPTAFYDILGLESVRTTVTDVEIKKAYRKISLLTHPDKNGHEHADEAFKMVSRAFGVLGDKEKRAKYDRYGGDPDSRFGGGPPPSNPFSGFAGGAPRSRGPAGGGGGGGSMWEEEISPEEMFNRFFGGGMGGGFGGFGGGGGMFNDGPGFMFNLNGGPGIRVHQFGGARPRRRPRDPNAPEETASPGDVLKGLLPLLLIFVLPLITSFFSSSSSAGPSVRFTGPEPPITLSRFSKPHNTEYWVNPVEVENYTPKQFHMLDQEADRMFVQEMRVGCVQEEEARQRLVQEAQGWFGQDQQKMLRAQKMEMLHCKKLEELKMRARRS
ncbi:hypothetical protein B0J14DRAFT_562696 [Halenospora varia]|nr:hypothetical protein B0J14DRAFT_562696 [Halenospora varia]